MLQTVQQLYGNILAGIGVFFLVFSAINHIWQIAITKAPSNAIPPELEEGEPVISVLIPARNEEDNIGECIESLLNQNYPRYEILIIDDNSEDKTWPLIEEYSRKNPELVRVFKGKPLLDGWQGKCWALDQLVQQARGRYLLFTDADTRHSPDSLSFTVANLEGNRADMISGYTRQIMNSFGEKITVPLQFLLTGIFLLLPLNSLFKRVSIFSPAIGQYIGVNRKKFIEIGGWSLVKYSNTDDIVIGRKCKQAGFRTFFVNCSRAVSCRMFSGFKNAQDGIARCIFDFFDRRSLPLFLAFLGVLSFMVVPIFLGIAALIKILFLEAVITPFITCVALNVLFIFFTWFFLFMFQKIPVYYAFLYPLFFINLFYVAFLSWYRADKKGHVWRGRVLQ